MAERTKTWCRWRKEQMGPMSIYEDLPDIEFPDSPEVAQIMWMHRVTKGHPEYYQPELFDDPGPEEYEREMFRKQDEGTFEYETLNRLDIPAHEQYNPNWLHENTKKKKKVDN